MLSALGLRHLWAQPGGIGNPGGMGFPFVSLLPSRQESRGQGKSYWAPGALGWETFSQADSAEDPASKRVSAKLVWPQAFSCARNVAKFRNIFTGAHLPNLKLGLFSMKRL